MSAYGLQPRISYKDFLQTETDFMNYWAVLDLDGTAWSERFARLLCYNSVVIHIEVDNDLEEYFYFDGGELQPHVHYLPATLKNYTLVPSRTRAQWPWNASLPTPTFGVGPTWSFRNSTKPLRRLWRDALAFRQGRPVVAPTLGRPPTRIRRAASVFQTRRFTDSVWLQRQAQQTHLVVLVRLSFSGGCVA